MINWISQSDVLPVDLDSVKANLRIHSADNSQDAYLTELIEDATDYIEKRTGNAYLEYTFDLILPSFWTEPQKYMSLPPYWPYSNYQIPLYNTTQNNFWHRRIYLPRPPLGQVVSVQYYAPDATSLTTLDASNYIVVASTYEAGFIEPIPSTTWPATSIRSDAVQIRFTCGTTIPSTFRRCLMLVCGWFNENREGQAKDVDAIESLIKQLTDGGYH